MLLFVMEVLGKTERELNTELEFDNKELILLLWSSEDGYRELIRMEISAQFYGSVLTWIREKSITNKTYIWTEVSDFLGLKITYANYAHLNATHQFNQNYRLS